MPCPSHTPTVFFPSVTLGGAKPNAAASRQPMGLLLVLQFNSRYSKWEQSQKLNSASGDECLGALSVAEGEEKSSMWDFACLKLGLSSEVPLKGACPYAPTVGAAQGG